VRSKLALNLIFENTVNERVGFFNINPYAIVAIVQIFYLICKLLIKTAFALNLSGHLNQLFLQSIKIHT